MFKPLRLLVLALLLSLCRTAVDGHVHSQSGQRHGGLCELLEPAKPSVSPVHRCTGRVPHLHPSISREHTECFLCAKLRKSGVPRLEPISAVEPFDSFILVHGTPAGSKGRLLLSSVGPRAPPLG